MTAKTKIIISDTHIGAGGADAGNRLEDFISDDVFYDWIHRLIRESEVAGRDMTLIINGDWIEFLQVPAVDHFDPGRRYPTEAYTDVSETASLQRLEVVHAGHPRVFQALSDFLSPGPPRRDLVILFGNHDPELIYPGVQARIRALLHAQGERADLVRIGERRYFEDGVLVEHGNAYTEQVDRFTQPDYPVDPKHPHLIERPPGSYVVTDFYNRIEPIRPWIDGVHPMSSLIFYALAYDPLFAVQVLKAFVAAMPDLIPDLATGEAPASAPWAEMDERALARRLREDEAFAQAFAEDAERVLAVKGAVPPALSAPMLAAGSPRPKRPQERAREIAEQYWQMLEEAAGQVAREMGAKVVVFGHIHERVQRRLPGHAVYLNTGTWIWKMNFKDASDAVWYDLIAHPEKYMYRRELTYARIDIDGSGKITGARLLLANEPEAPPPPPETPPPDGLWARGVLWLRQVLAKLTGWL